ncbi:helix-turn-helix domain-containing protein [Novosphingobium mangrovi (ex Huang et al. 2023)]|uniref:AraC family transcriptional regulator n=1 Tax=Novosphingobium mangrovi (ex Huang et al. 2023) TaxID=2976432 RepID=A0ABT2I5C9_9SPHN|nr:AraC family transcriptional regulator [Novosphingobium mangrovi (ex Huang et al. 2023)]MCT2400013.1 AraC family transcriptional regulator [Novosphingobium mangrovi (ex Huang et al. 2023)]
MTETLFSFDKRNYRECQQMFRGTREQEYYLGELRIEDASTVDVRSERKTVGAISIIKQRSATNLSFRRSRQHIREDATDLSILWFVKHGELALSNQCGNKVARPGDFVITRSMSPFFIECRTDSDNVHEVLHVTVPTHILRSYIQQNFSTGLFMPMERAELAIAENILTDVFEDDGGLGEESARLLAETAFGLIGNAVRAAEDVQPARQSIAERRLEEVLRFIEVHLSDPQLSTAMVAKGCGISPRYLSFLLRLRETSFSELVWEQRLAKAKAWLASSDPHDISISEIAYGVGFKSPAHFSRMFKRVFGANPREYRGECSAREAMAVQVETSEGFPEYPVAGQLLQ